MIINRLEESVSEQNELDQSIPADKDGAESLKIEEAADGQQSQTRLDEEAIREFFSAKNLKNVRNDPSKRSSSCFGRRMDRIGSMSSLGCNTVGKYSKSFFSAVTHSLKVRLFLLLRGTHLLFRIKTEQIYKKKILMT